MCYIDIEKLKNDAKNIEIDYTYKTTYVEFVNYFRNLKIGNKKINWHNFIIGSCFTYSWMPPGRLILHINDIENVNIVIPFLNEVLYGNTMKRDFEIIMVNEVKKLIHSLVGISKLLHFINPDIYPIWDSNVCKYFLEIPVIPRDNNINNCDNYFNYIDYCQKITKSEEYNDIHEIVVKKVNYTEFEMTRIRTLELIMFYNGRNIKNQKHGL